MRSALILVVMLVSVLGNFALAQETVEEPTDRQDDPHRSVSSR